MDIQFIAQPENQLGRCLEAALIGPPRPTAVWVVTAFVHMQAVLRLKPRMLALHAAGTAVRFVVGVDMGGTSREVLSELSSWPVEVFVFKNRKSGVTFHPKFYVIESAKTAEIFMGSNNLTDGGLYKNYEGTVRVTYALPADFKRLTRAKAELARFLDPPSPVGRRLDAGYLAQLLTRPEIPSEVEARQRRKVAAEGTGTIAALPDVFGFESTPGAPSLPRSVQEAIVNSVREQIAELKAARKKTRKKAKGKTGRTRSARGTSSPKVDLREIKPKNQFFPQAFYLELTTTKGAHGNIPGEQRIPLEAISSAQEFWGWPEKYTEKINPRKGPSAKGEKRVYVEWKPTWRVHQFNKPARDVTLGVRLYYYKNSSDFRFHAGALRKWAKGGDIVRITRPEDGKVAFDCTLAVARTKEHREWKALCTLHSENSPRGFGFE